LTLEIDLFLLDSSNKKSLISTEDMGLCINPHEKPKGFSHDGAL